MTTTLQLHPRARDALAVGAPVVALESTIISHGMPYPQNVETARAVENIVREHGAEPATIAVLDGQCVVGLDDAQLEQLGQRGDVHKATTRDLAWLAATRSTGATTVAATMHLAHRAGIRVFATGGIGGVHRGASTTFDISADLTELARTSVAVVCAGVKSILDIGSTLEYLETFGVAVIVTGADEFPSFYSRGSGFDAPRRLDSSAEIAAFLDAQRALGIGGGAVIANPIPAADEIPRAEIDAIIDTALADLSTHRVHGRAVTPWLLARIVEATQGRSLTANIALMKNNAALAADIAVALASIRPS